jgi:hypothetical protein
VPAAVAGVIVPSLAPYTSGPLVATMGGGVAAPPIAPGSGTPSMNAPPEHNPIYGAERSTARKPAYDPPPSATRRVLVAGSAAVLVAAVALAIAFWPSKPPDAATPAGAGATAASSATTTAATTAGAGATTAGTTGVGTTAAGPATVEQPPRPPTATVATIQITVDAPARIAVDGKPQVRGGLATAATVEVEPGVEHLVTVQRPGHSVRRLHVPALAPGERMPLKFSVR